MFENCSGLTSLDLSSFDISDVETLGGVFGYTGIDEFAVNCQIFVKNEIMRNLILSVRSDLTNVVVKTA